MKYLIYTTFYILLLNSASLFAKMGKIPTIDVILEQSSSVMIDNINFRETQEKQIRKIYKVNLSFIHKILSKKVSDNRLPLIGMIYTVEGTNTFKSIFLSSDSTIFCLKYAFESMTEMLVVREKEMSTEQKEVVSNLRNIYNNKSKLIKYKRDLSKFKFDGVVSIFSICDSDYLHMFVVTSYSNNDIKYLFNRLKESYKIFSKDRSIDSIA